VPTGTRIPAAFTNTLWDRKLESGRQGVFDLSPQGSAAASQADGNSGGEHLPREQGLREPRGPRGCKNRDAERVIRIGKPQLGAWWCRRFPNGPFILAA
jgi:hypothetical protein